MKRLHYTIIIATTLIVVALPVGQTGIQRAEALSLGDLFGVLGGGGGQRVTIVGNTSITDTTTAIKSTLSELANTGSFLLNQSLNLKEFTLDGIARGIAQSALNQMMADMIEWVNGGFDGSPAFVTNLDEFMLRVRDDVATNLIYGSELNALCEPIQFQVKATILKQYTEESRGTYTPHCTLDDVPGVDIEAFLEGDFSKGGLAAFFELTVGGNNDPIKAYYNAQAELYQRATAAEENEETELGWSRGFLSKEACSFIEDATGFARQRCETLTPGSLIGDVLSYYVGELPAQQLLNTDEFNEVFSGLMSGILNQSLGGQFGLRGLGGSGQYSNNQFGDGSQSFADALRSETTGTNTSGLANLIADAIAAETTFSDLQGDVLADITDLETELEEGREDYPSCFDLELSDELTTAKDSATVGQAISSVLLVEFQSMQEQLQNATSSTAQAQVSNKFVALRTTDFCADESAAFQSSLACKPVKTSQEVRGYEIDYIDIQFAALVAQFEQEIDAERDECN